MFRKTRESPSAFRPLMPQARSKHPLVEEAMGLLCEEGAALAFVQGGRDRLRRSLLNLTHTKQLIPALEALAVLAATLLEHGHTDAAKTLCDVMAPALRISDGDEAQRKKQAQLLGREKVRPVAERSTERGKSPLDLMLERAPKS